MKLAMGVALLYCLMASTSPAALAQPAPSDAQRSADLRIVFPDTVPQGALVLGKVPAGSRVRHGQRDLRVSDYGTVVLGVGRDQAGPVLVQVTRPDGGQVPVSIAVSARDWPVQHVKGVPPRTVNPPPAVAERIAREQALVTAARVRDDARTDFAKPFVWPVQGRISGRFGNGRVYTATDGSVQQGSGHSGMDIAVATGTPVKAPAAGVVTFAAEDLYLTGGTLLLDHGYGVSSNFLHLSRIDVKPGDRVEQGQVIAAVGATGRATGPHLHWGMNWFDVRVDPLLVLERTP